MQRFWVVVVIAICACGKKGKETDPCGAAGQQYAKVWEKEKPDKARKGTTNGNQLAGACRGGEWGEAALKCLRSITSLADAKACAAKASDDDREEIEAELAQLDPPPPDDCKSVSQHLIDLGREENDAVGDERAKALRTMGAASEAMLKTCRDMKWSKDMTDCMLAATKIDDAEACGEKLTQEQKDAWAKAIAALPSGDDGGGATCDQAADHMAGLQRDQMMALPADQQKNAQDKMTKARDAMADACQKTKWSAAAIECMVAIQAVEDAKDCAQHMTPEQSTAWLKTGAQ